MRNDSCQSKPVIYQGREPKRPSSSLDDTNRWEGGKLTRTFLSVTSSPIKEFHKNCHHRQLRDKQEPARTPLYEYMINKNPEIRVETPRRLGRVTQSDCTEA